VSVGTIVDTSTVITTLDDTSVIKLDFDVPEVFLANLQPGMQVAAHSAAWPGVDFNGNVAFIDTRVDPVTRSVTVRAVIPNEEERLRPGMFLTVSLLKQEATALTVPEEAVVPEGSRQYVFVVDNEGVAELREIETGRRRPGEVEILSGLQAGEIVITEGTQKARDGQTVTVSGSRSTGGGDLNSVSRP